MAEDQLTLPGEMVKKDNMLTRSKINISNVLSSRILATLIACIRTDDTCFKHTYCVPIKDFIVDESGRGYTEIKKACRELASATAEVEFFGPKGKKTFIVYTFFSFIRYYNGTVKARFNKEMGELLLGLKKCFTQYNLIEFLALPSLYSQRLFEILKSWAKAPNVVIEVAELHVLLNTPASFRTDFRQFRLHVLEKAHTDICEKTSFYFQWEPIRSGRRVRAIRFIFSPEYKTAIVDAEAKAKEEKRRRLGNQRIFSAVECAQEKKGECLQQDNKRLVCKVCQQMHICNEVRRKSQNYNDFRCAGGRKTERLGD